MELQLDPLLTDGFYTAEWRHLAAPLLNCGTAGGVDGGGGVERGGDVEGCRGMEGG